MSVVKKILSKVLNFIFESYGYPVVKNANNSPAANDTLRALFIYQPDPFLFKKKNRMLVHHSHRQAVQIVNAIGDMGYIVDVSDYRDMKFKPKYYYDLIISHNTQFDVKRIIRPSGKKPVVIYFSSGAYAVDANQKIKSRYSDLQERRSAKLMPKRLSAESTPFIENADYIVGYGNQNVLDGWGKAFEKPVYPFNNYGYKETINSFTRDYSKLKYNFLFFSGGDMVGKGLDLLLEIFAELKDLNLYICAPLQSEQDFLDCYQKELYETPNIHLIGFVQPLSEQFYEIVKKCSFVIHPSAAEGQPGGVVQCMHSGLIPIVSKECGLDVNGFGVELKDCKPETIKNTLVSLINKDEDWYNSISQNVVDTARKYYSEEYFMLRWKNILNDILQKREQ